MSFNAEYNDDIVVTTEEVVRAVQKLDTGKSSGLDGIFAEHLLHCSERLLSMLAECITGFFVHGFLPCACERVWCMHVCLFAGSKNRACDRES